MNIKASTVLACLVLCFATSQANADNAEVVIHNETGDALCITIPASPNRASACNHDHVRKIKVPIQLSNGTETRQILVYGGGYWKADSSGWATYREMKVCEQRTFEHNSGSVDWSVNTYTGIVGNCSPGGYRAF